MRGLLMLGAGAQVFDAGLYTSAVAVVVKGENTARPKNATSPQERGRNTRPSARMKTKSSPSPTTIVSPGARNRGIRLSQSGE